MAGDEGEETKEVLKERRYVRSGRAAKCIDLCFTTLFSFIQKTTTDILEVA